MTIMSGVNCKTFFVSHHKNNKLNITNKLAINRRCAQTIRKKLINDAVFSSEKGSLYEAAYRLLTTERVTIK